MKRAWWLGLVTGVLVGAVTLAAVKQLHAKGGASGDGIAVIDVVRLYGEYERQKDLGDEMYGLNERMQNEEQRRRGQIDSLQATLDAMNYTDSTYTERQREMLQMQIDYKNWGELMQADMAREVGLWTRRIYDEIQQVAEEVAQRKGIDIILYKDQPELIGFDPEVVREQIRQRKLIYSNPAVDITQELLDKLNTAYRAAPKTQMLQISP